MRGRFKRLGMLAVCLVSAGFFARWTVPHAAWFLDVGERPREVDFVVALPGEFETRPFVAAALIKAGYAKKAVIVSNTDAVEKGDGLIPPSHEIVRRIYQARGIDSSSITIMPGASNSTIDDLQQLKTFLMAHPDATACVVTSGFHTRRVRWIVKTKFPEIVGRVYFVSAPNPSFDEQGWWRFERGFMYVVSEYLKFVAYWFSIGNGIYWTAGMIGIMLLGRWCFRNRFRATSKTVEL